MLSNLTLIGMPGAGKSTIGIILAKNLSLGFIDTDVLIQINQGKSLQQILDESGHLALRAIEEEEICKLNVNRHVIATGGSAAYSTRAMEHLKREGICVFLHVDLPTLNKRIRNYETRGLAKRPDQSFQDLFDERLGLYRRHADITISASVLSQEAVCEEIIEKLKEYRRTAGGG